MLTSLPFLSRWSFLGTMEDTRTVLFSCWLDLANDKIFSAIDCGVLFFRSLVPQWIMIRSGLFLSVGLIYDSMTSVFAPRKDLTTNKSFLVDNSQPLTFLTMESPTSTVTLWPFSFWPCHYHYCIPLYHFHLSHWELHICFELYLFHCPEFYHYFFK